ncbi:hypothetical protein EB093_03465 [bacterium]|nr:hypothetical protein [bacterium]
MQQQLLGQVFNSIASAKGADGGHDNVKMEALANDISRLLAMNTTGKKEAKEALGAIVRAGFDIAGSTNNVDLLHAFTDHAIKSATVREGQRSGAGTQLGGIASKGVSEVLKLIDAAGASGSIDSIKAVIRGLNEAEKQDLFDRISKRSSAGNKVAIDKFLSKGEKYAAIYREFNGVEGYVLPDKLAPLFETIVTKGTPAVQGLAPGERERLTAEKRRLEGQRHDTAKDRIELTGLTAQRDQLNEDLGGQLAAQKGLTATVQSLTQEVAGQRLQQNKLAGELEATGGEITKIQTDLSQLRDKKQAGDATHQATREALQSELNKVTAISAEKNEQGIKLKASQKTAELKLKLKDQQIKKELDAKAKKEETLKNDIARETAHIAQLTEQRNAAVASERAAAQQEVLKQTVQAVANSAISAALRNVPSSQTTGGGTEHVPVAPKIGPKLFPSPPLLQAKGDTMPVAPQMGPNPSPSTQLPQHTGDVSPQPEPTPNPNIKVAERLQQLILQQKGALSHLERIGNIHAIRELAAITKGTTLPTGLLDMSRSGLLEKSKQQELTALLNDQKLLKGPSWSISGDKIQGRAIDIEKISKLNPEQRQALDQKITALLSTGRSTETPNSIQNSIDGIKKILDGTYSADRITALQAKLVVGARSYDDYLETAKTFGTSATLTPLIDKLKESDAATQKEYNARLANFAQQFRERGLNKQDIATVYDRVILWFGDAADSKAVGEKFSDIFSSHRRGFDLKTSAVEFSDLADRVRGQSRFQDRGKLLADNYAKAVAGMNTSHNTLEAAGARAYGWKRTDAADKLAKERRFNAEVMMGIEAEFRSEIVDFLDRGQTADVRSMMAGALSNPAARAMVSGAIQLLAAEKDMYGSNRLDQLQRVMLPATDYDTSRGTDNHLAMMSEFSKAWVDATSKASPSAEMSGPQTTLRGGRSMTGGNAGFLNNPIKWMLGDGDELANSLASNFARQLPIIGWFYGADGGDQSPHFREMVRGKGDNIAQLDNIHSIERKLGRDAAKALLDMPADQLQAMVASLDEASVAKLVKNIGGERAKILMTRIKNDENSTVVMDAQIAKLSSVIKSTPEPTSQSVGGAQTIEPTLNPLHQDSEARSHAVTEVTEDNRAAFITMQGQTLLPELLRRAAGELRPIPTSQNGPISPSTSVRYTPESMTSARRLLEPLRGLDRFFEPTDPQTDTKMPANLTLLQNALSGSEMTAGAAQQLASQLRQGTPPGEPARDTTTTPNPLIPRGTEKFIAIQKLTEGMTLNGLTVTDSAGPDDSATHHATATQRVNALHEEITSVLSHTVTSDLGDAAPSIGKLAEYDSPAAAHQAIVAITNDLTIYLGVQKDLETQKYDRETDRLAQEQTTTLDSRIKELDSRTQDYSLKLKQRSHEIVSMAVSVVKGNASGGAVALAQMVGKLRQSGLHDVVKDIAYAIAKVQQNDTFLTFLDEQVSQAKAKSTGKISKDVQYLSEFADQIQKSTIPKQPESLKLDQEQLNQRTEQVLGRFERIRVLDRLASEFNATTNIENIQKVVTDPAVSNDIARLVAQGLALDAKSAGRFLAVLAQKNVSLATDLFDQVTVELGRLNAGDDPRPLRADIDRVEKVLKAAAVPDQVYVQALQSIKPLKPFHNIATVEGRRAVNDLQSGRISPKDMAARLAQRTPDQARDIVRHVGTADRQLGVALITDLVRLNPVHASATISGLASGLRPGQLGFNDLRALVAAVNQEVTSPQFEASINDPKISDGLPGVKDHFTRELATIEKQIQTMATVESRVVLNELKGRTTSTQDMADRLAQRTPDQVRDIIRYVGTEDLGLGVALVTDLVTRNPEFAGSTISGLASGLRPGQPEFYSMRELLSQIKGDLSPAVQHHFTRELATIEKQIASDRTGAVLGLDTMAITEHIVNAGFSVVAEVAKGVSQWVPSSGSTGPLSEFRQSGWASNGMRAFLDADLSAVDGESQKKLTPLQTTVQTHVASVADFISHKLETLSSAHPAEMQNLLETVPSMSSGDAITRMAAVAQLTPEQLNELGPSIKPTMSMMSHIAKSIETPLKFLAEHLANCSSREMATMLRNPHTADQINRLLTTSPELLTGTHVVGTILDLGTALESIAPTIGRTLVTSADADIQNAVTLHALTHPSTNALVERTAQQCLTEIEGQIRQKFAVPAERQQLDDALANVERVRKGDVTTEPYRTAVTALNALGLGLDVTAFNAVDTVRQNVAEWSQTLQDPTIDTLQQMAEVLGKGTIDTALKFNPTGYLNAVATSGEPSETSALKDHWTALRSVNANPKDLGQALLNQLIAMGGTPPTELTADQVVGVSLLAHSPAIVAEAMNDIARLDVNPDIAMAVINGANQLRLEMATAIDRGDVKSLTTEGLHGASVNLLSANQVLTQRSKLTGNDINRLAKEVETKQQKNELYATHAIALSRTIEVATGRSLGVPESLDGTTAVHHLADIYTQLSENPGLDPNGEAKGSIAKAFVSELCNLKKSDALFAASPELKAQLMNTLRLIGESKVTLTDLGGKLTPGQFEHFLNNLENLNLSGAERLQMRQHQAVLTEKMGVLQNPRLVQSIAARDPQLLSDAISQTTTPETAAARVLDVAEALNDPEFNDPELTRAIIGDLRSRDISRNPQFWKTFLKEIADKSGAPHIPGLTPPVDQASVDQLGQRIADRQLKADFSDFAYESFSMRPSSEDVGAVAHSQLLTALLTPNSASLISSETYDGRRSELVGILNHPPAPSPHPLNSIVHVANGRLMLDHLSRSDQDSAEKLAALVASPHLSPSARELVANLPAVKIQLLSGLDRNECRETLGTVLPEGMGRIPGDPEPLRVTMPTRWILEQVPSVIPQANKASLTILLNQSPRLDRYAGAINANPEFPGILKEECRNKPLTDKALNSMLAIASPQTIETVVGKLMDEDTSKGLQILSHPQVLVGQRHRLEPVVRQLMTRYPGPTWDGAEGDMGEIVSMIRRNSNPREGVGTGLGTSTQSVREERQGDSVAQTLGKIGGKSELTRRAELQQLLQTSDTRDQLFRQLTDESNTTPFGPDRRAILETLRSLTAGTPDEIKMDIISANTRRFAIGEVAKKSTLDDRIIAAATHWEVVKGSSDSASHMLSLIVDDPMSARQMELSGRVVKRLTEGSNRASVEFDRALATAWMSQSDDNAVSVIDQLKTNPDKLRSILADVYRDTAGIPPYPSKAATAYGAIVKQAIGYNKSLDSTKIRNSGVPTDHVIAILHQTWQEDPLEFNGVMNRFLETPLDGTDSDKKFTQEQIALYTGLIGQKQDYSFSHNGRRNVNVKVNATGHGLVHLIPDRSFRFLRLHRTPELRQNPWTTVLFRAGQDQQVEILGDLKGKKIGVEVVRQLKENYAAAEGNRQIGTTTGNPFGVTQNQVDNLDTLLEKTDGYIGSGNIKKTQALVTQLRHQFPGINSGFGLASREKLTSLLANRLLYNDKALLAVTGPMTLIQRQGASRSPVSDIGADQVKTTMPVLKDAYERVSGVINNTSTSNDAVLSTIRDYIETASISRMVDAMLPQFKIGSALATAAERIEPLPDTAADGTSLPGTRFGKAARMELMQRNVGLDTSKPVEKESVEDYLRMYAATRSLPSIDEKDKANPVKVRQSETQWVKTAVDGLSQNGKCISDIFKGMSHYDQRLNPHQSVLQNAMIDHFSGELGVQKLINAAITAQEHSTGTVDEKKDRLVTDLLVIGMRIPKASGTQAWGNAMLSAIGKGHDNPTHRRIAELVDGSPDPTRISDVLFPKRQVLNLGEAIDLKDFHQALKEANGVPAVLDQLATLISS